MLRVVSTATLGVIDYTCGDPSSIVTVTLIHVVGVNVNRFVSVVSSRQLIL